ncbi:hypothetical protein M1N67_01505 [Peptococcaceae bacterium]|nr:hypothetical protein [Peptococcaceae bacterium]
MTIRQIVFEGAFEIEKVAYILLAIVALFWLAGMFLGMIAAFPIGVVGIIGTMGIGLLLKKLLVKEYQTKKMIIVLEIVDK